MKIRFVDTLRFSSASCCSDYLPAGGWVAAKPIELRKYQRFITKH